MSETNTQEQPDFTPIRKTRQEKRDDCGARDLRERICCEAVFHADALFGGKRQAIPMSEWRALVERLASLSPIDLHAVTEAAKLFHLRKYLQTEDSARHPQQDPVTGINRIPNNVMTWDPRVPDEEIEPVHAGYGEDEDVFTTDFLPVLMHPGPSSEENGFESERLWPGLDDHIVDPND